jgi:beta-N-acetylhexosaminidase
MARPRAIIASVAGAELTEEERKLFTAENPLGFILFARNCRDAAQIKKLVADLRAAVGRPDAPVLIDEEGGRVSRLPHPEFPRFPAAGTLGTAAAARQQGRDIGKALAGLGIDVNCAPVLDVPAADADPVIGDRAFSGGAAGAGRKGKAEMRGMLEAGVMPVVKHIPGHGRATADSHKALPRVSASLDDLRARDFPPFKACNRAGWGMTAHIVFEAVDPHRPATQSAKVIRDIIRGEIGFAGVLVSDDLSMKALTGDLADRAGKALAAGCDLALYCAGDLAEMKALLPHVPELRDDSLARLARAERMRKRALAAARKPKGPSP